jgi:hypothetical protein
MRGKTSKTEIRQETTKNDKWAGNKQNDNNVLLLQKKNKPKYARTVSL